MTAKPTVAVPVVFYADASISVEQLCAYMSRTGWVMSPPIEDLGRRSACWGARGYQWTFRHPVDEAQMGGAIQRIAEAECRLPHEVLRDVAAAVV